jgi:hypothetical protein
VAGFEPAIPASERLQTQIYRTYLTQIIKIKLRRVLSSVFFLPAYTAFENGTECSETSTHNIHPK